MDSTRYEAASRYFIHREFAKALQELGETGPAPSKSAWVLYLALCERAFIEPDREDWPFNCEDRKQLRNAVLKSQIWTEMELRWDSINEKVPQTLIQSGFTQALKHRSDPRPIITFMEHYMSSGPIPGAVFTAFIRDILMSLQHDFFYAREMVNKNDNIDQKILLAEIDAAEEQYEQDLIHALDLQKKQEEQRLLDAMNSAAAKEKEESEPTTSSSDTANENESSNNDTPSALETITDNEVARKTEKSNVPAHQRRSLVEHWKHWLHQFVRSQGLYNTLIFVIVVAGIVSSRRARVTLLRSTQWLWKSLKNGLNMGLRVTYL